MTFRLRLDTRRQEHRDRDQAPCLPELTDEERFSLDHPSPPPTHRRRGGLSPDAVLTGPAQVALGVPPAYRDVGFSAARFGDNSPGDDTELAVHLGNAGWT